jgi:hypothetical protein
MISNACSPVARLSGNGAPAGLITLVMSESGPERRFAAGQHDAGNGRKSGRSADVASTVAADPTATLVLHCANGFDASLSPYQNTRLSRYDAVS